MTVGQTITCTSCKSPHAISLIITDEWRAKCRTCRFSRKFGQARMSATVIATSHRLRLNHRIDVLYGDLTENEYDHMIALEDQARIALAEGGLILRGPSSTEL